MLWTLRYMYLFEKCFSYFRYVPSSIVSFFETLLYCFHSDYVSLHSHQQHMRIPLSPHCHQYLLFVFFLVIDILASLRWYLILLLICFSPMISESFPDSSVGKESSCNARDPGSIPGLGRSAGEGIGYPLQYPWASLVV